MFSGRRESLGRSARPNAQARLRAGRPGNIRFGDLPPGSIGKPFCRTLGPGPQAFTLRLRCFLSDSALAYA